MSFILGLFQEFIAKWQLSNLLLHLKRLRFDQAVYLYVPVNLRGSAGFPLSTIYYLVSVKEMERILSAVGTELL